VERKERVSGKRRGQMLYGFLKQGNQEGRDRGGDKSLSTNFGGSKGGRREGSSR